MTQQGRATASAKAGQHPDLDKATQLGHLRGTAVCRLLARQRVAGGYFGHLCLVGVVNGASVALINKGCERCIGDFQACHGAGRLPVGFCLAQYFHIGKQGVHAVFRVVADGWCGVGKGLGVHGGLPLWVRWGLVRQDHPCGTGQGHTVVKAQSSRWTDRLVSVAR